MTYLCASVNSWSLGIKTNVRLLLPDLEPGQAPPPEGYAVLYLLHGYTGDGGDWMRLSRLERYLENKQAVAVMPDGGKGFYTDTCSGDAYWTYLSQELPQFIETNFAVSNRRERTFAAGLSMGGYGALKLALRRPERYAAAASFSGVVDVADTMELTANPNRMAKGTVIEAKLDTGRGPVATVLIQTGTLHSGEAIIAGTAVGRVRVMTNDKGQKVEEAGPSCPVEITGLAEVPAAGDIFNAVEDEKLARELVEKRRMEQKEEEFKRYQKVTLDNLFEHISEGEVLELPVIVKGDVQGSVEAVRQSLEKLSNNEVRVRVIHGAVGAVSESDVMLANASHAIIVGFNVRPDPTAKANAERDGVEIRLYRIIYDAIEEIEAAMKGMLKPKTEEVDLGRAEIRNVYKITGVGAVAGCYVLDGKMVRSANIRVVRDGIIIADDKMASLRRFKDDVKEVAQGYECGITLEKFSDLKNGDIFEAYEIREIKQ